MRVLDSTRRSKAAIPSGDHAAHAEPDARAGQREIDQRGASAAKLDTGCVAGACDPVVIALHHRIGMQRTYLVYMPAFLYTCVPRM